MIEPIISRDIDCKIALEVNKLFMNEVLKGKSMTLGHKIGKIYVRRIGENYDIAKVFLNKDCNFHEILAFYNFRPCKRFRISLSKKIEKEGLRNYLKNDLSFRNNRQNYS